MGRNHIVSVFLKIFFPAVIFAAVFFSCKSAAPAPVEEAAPQESSFMESGPPQIFEEETVMEPAAESVGAASEMRGSSPEPAAEADITEDQNLLETMDASSDIEEEPDMTIAQELPAEEQLELPQAAAEAEEAASEMRDTPSEIQPQEEALYPESEAQNSSPSVPTEAPPVEPPQPAPQPEVPQQSPPSASREPPLPPSFLRPAEPENPPPVREPVPVPWNPLPQLPSRPLAESAAESAGAASEMRGSPPVPAAESAGRGSPPVPAAEAEPDQSRFIRRESAANEEQIVFSRIVRAIAGQSIEIPFRGAGWVYLGELANRRGISYDSRRLDISRESSGSSFIEGQSFIFHAETPGTYILKFYKQDFIRDYIINDYVQIIVGEVEEYSGSGRSGLPADRGRVIAEPRWPLISEPAATAQSSPAETVITPAGDTQIAAPAAETTVPAQAGSAAVTMTPPPAATAAPAAGMSAVPETRSSPPPAVITPRPRQTSGDDGIVPVAPPQAVSSAAQQRPDAASTNSIQTDASPDEYIRRAKLEFDAGRVESALTILDTMKQRYPSGTDEAWWLYGQLLESNSSSRDIRLALEYYRRLIREYPQSSRAGDAQRRIAYLERYYFNIR